MENLGELALQRAGRRGRTEGGQAIVPFRTLCPSMQFERAGSLLGETYARSVALPRKGNRHYPEEEAQELHSEVTYRDIALKLCYLQATSMTRSSNWTLVLRRTAYTIWQCLPLVLHHAGSDG